MTKVPLLAARVALVAVLRLLICDQKPLDLQGSYEVKDRNAMRTIHKVAKETDSLFYRNHGNILNFQHNSYPKTPSTSSSKPWPMSIITS